MDALRTHTHAHTHTHTRDLQFQLFERVVNEGFNTAVVQGRVLEFESAERFRELESFENRTSTHTGHAENPFYHAAASA